MRGTTFASELSARALATPEPFVRMFARRVQQEGALDLTQGDYKNADFAPHPEVVRAAQRITRNTVHSYGPAVGRMDVRNEVAEFFNRDGMIDYPGTEVRSSRTRSCSRRARVPVSPSCSRCSAPTAQASWSRGRAGNTTGSSSAPAKGRRTANDGARVPPDPQEVDRILGRGGISSLIIDNPAQPHRARYPGLVEELVRVAVRHRCYVLYDSVYQRLDYVGRFANPAFATRSVRPGHFVVGPVENGDVRRVHRTGLLAGDVGPDAPRRPGPRDFRQPLRLARRHPVDTGAGLGAPPLDSPLAALRRPSPYMRERCDFMAAAADPIAPLGVERTDFGCTFYFLLAFRAWTGTVRTAAQRFSREGDVVPQFCRRVRIPPHRRCGRHSVHGFRWGGDPRTAMGPGNGPSGLKDVKELGAFIDRARARIERQGRLDSVRRRCRPRAPPRSKRITSGRTPAPAAYAAFYDVDLAFAAARGAAAPTRGRGPRLTGTNTPTHRPPRRTVQRALATPAAGGPRGPRPRLSRVESAGGARPSTKRRSPTCWAPATRSSSTSGPADQPRVARHPEKVVLAPLRHGVVPGRRPSPAVPRPQSLGSSRTRRSSRRSSRPSRGRTAVLARRRSPRLRARRRTRLTSHPAGERQGRHRRAGQDRHVVAPGDRRALRGPYDRDRSFLGSLCWNRAGPS